MRGIDTIRKKILGLSLGAASALALAAPQALAAPVYYLTDLGGTYSRANGISDSGKVVGVIADHAFLYDGSMHDLGTLGGSSSIAYGINDAGQVVGWSYTAGNTARHVFLYDSSMHDLGTLGGTEGFGFDINNAGKVVGESSIAGDAAYHPFLYDGSMHDIGTYGYASGINDAGKAVGVIVSHAFFYDGSVHDLGTLGGSASVAIDINEADKVVGYSFTAGNTASHAFLYDGSMHDLGTLGGSSSIANGINNAGQVVGAANTTSGVLHAFLYDGVAMLDLNDLIDGADPLAGLVTLFDAQAINDNGDIAATGTIGGQTHAFLLTAERPKADIPEPAGFALLALGLCGLGALRRGANHTAYQ